jgi:MoxR-like ATPase
MSEHTTSPRTLLNILETVIVGQRPVLEAMVLALIADGHMLLEGPPGLAKTLTCRVLAACVGGTFRRVQFTPDLLPGDIVGTRIFDQRIGDFRTVLGPIFANVLLADEINRAPAKVQSALLEGMQERQVTIGPETHALPDPFIVTATMNPIESEGVYALPQAQMDRFLVKLLVTYPSQAEEIDIAERFGGDVLALPRGILSMEDVVAWRHAAREVFIEKRLFAYITALVGATRKPHAYIEHGAGPRATLALVALGRARAFLEGRSFVYPDDIRAAAPAVLRHRVMFHYRAVVDRVDTETLLAELIGSVPTA